MEEGREGAWQGGEERDAPAGCKPSLRVSLAPVERVARGQHSTFSEKRKSISLFQPELLQQRPPFQAAGELQMLKDGGKHPPTPAPRPAVSAPPRAGVPGITGGLSLRAPQDGAGTGLRRHPPERPQAHARTQDDGLDDLSAVTEVKLITQKPS